MKLTHKATLRSGDVLGQYLDPSGFTSVYELTTEGSPRRLLTRRFKDSERWITFEPRGVLDKFSDADLAGFQLPSSGQFQQLTSEKIQWEVCNGGN